MLRTHARIWIGLLACLLMQVGLMLGASTAQATTQTQPPHHMMMHHMAHHQNADMADCCTATALHAVPHSQPSSGGCCHTHAVSTEPMLTLTSVHPSAPDRTGSNVFAPRAHDRFSGKDWIPASPPPRTRAI
ncbi:hypothetical protein [Gluconobacter kanchanaburiensis]|uniref:DUF2946 domain-containing protein n=1 Tax=Gluconobacter kanchanaburiensis NBRC 103587 TaxID=1307948 RepID=A0A511B6S6_9PROT|nr:hypothetical protein [Gluconobacter kanchanaburiensis]MBF0861703.1 hypothetical protein [Gluconobacter kanchanaburiensis]GBR67270.1 hypothetical protein AA103587_0201 [Gluconobacter kanchanaburiensis NBRC 103587]GEK95351.1 hypothetical protein GKA01_05480 [Gluconobacter kanchanaburiensis NBRC 103587]